MYHSQKHFLFYKKSDFEQGYGENIEILKTGIRLKHPEKRYGIYFSKILDTKENSTIWDRFRADLKNSKEGSIYIRFYCSENSILIKQKQAFTLEEIIYNSAISIQEKLEWMKPYLVKEIYTKEDILLHEIIGRFLWIVIELRSQGEDLPEIRSMQIIFPKKTWISYLPEIYEQNSKSASFVERFLGIFKSMYDELLQEIEHVSFYLDPEVTSESFLFWLSEWFALENVYLWKEEQLRYLLKNVVRMYKKRGTVSYLKELLTLYTDSVPYIVEHHQLEQFVNDPKKEERNRKLYGNSSYEFTIMIYAEKTQIDYRAVTKIVENAAPANMAARIILLKPYIFLDNYTYLGINSVLNHYRELQLDGLSAVSFTTLKENKKEESYEKPELYSI